MKKIITASVVGLLLSSCGMSARHVSSNGIKASSLKVINLSPEDQIKIDNVLTDHPARSAILVPLPDGWHLVEISSPGQPTKVQRVFLQDGIEKILDAKIR